MKLRYVAGSIVVTSCLAWTVMALLLGENVYLWATFGALIGSGSALTTFLISHLGKTDQEW